MRGCVCQINDLGLLLKTTGKLPQAEQLYTEWLAGRRERFGNVHPKTLTSMNNLGALYYAQGRLEEARPLAEEALSGRRELLGDKQPETLQTVRSTCSTCFPSYVRAEREGHDVMIFLGIEIRCPLFSPCEEEFKSKP